MKILTIDYLRKHFQNVHPLTKKVHLNAIYSLLIRGAGMLISLVLVPLTIDYLSRDTYGTWLTINSIITMLTFFDIGIGNGLRNRFSEAIANGNITLAQTYVSTAYVIFGSMQIILMTILLYFVQYIPWQRLLNTRIDIADLQIVIMITIISIALKLVLDIISYILLAIHESSKVGVIAFISNLFIFIGTYALTKSGTNSIIYLATVSSLSPIIVLIISSILFYRKELKLYKPSLSSVKLKYVKYILTIGYKFFFIQIAVVIIFYTDNIIITQILGPSEVTTYNIAFKYFNIINTIFAIVITPYWSAFTEAFIKEDDKWIKNSYNHLKKIWIVLVLVVILMTLYSDIFYSLWIGNRVNVSLTLNICMALFTIISCWNNIVTSVVNGLGKIQLQLYYASFAAIINIPLSIFLCKKLNIGSAGVILGTNISLLIGTLFGTVQAKKIIFGKATGIWND